MLLFIWPGTWARTRRSNATMATAALLLLLTLWLIGTAIAASRTTGRGND